MQLEWTLTALSAAAIVWVIGEAAKFRAKQLDQQQACRDEFFGAAERLIADPKTPDHIIDDVDRLAHTLGSRTALWAFAGRTLARRLRDPDPRVMHSHYQSVPEHLRSDLVMTWVSWAFAVTFNNAILGTVIRRVTLYSVPRRRDCNMEDAAKVGPMVNEFAHGQARAA